MSQVFINDDGSKLFLDDAGNPLGAIGTDGVYYPPRAGASSVGDQLNSLLSLGVSQAVSRVLGGNTVTRQTAVNSAPSTGLTTTKIVTYAAVGAMLIGVGLGIAALVKG